MENFSVTYDVMKSAYDRKERLLIKVASNGQHYNLHEVTVLELAPAASAFKVYNMSTGEAEWWDSLLAKSCTIVQHLPPLEVSVI